MIVFWFSYSAIIPMMYPPAVHLDPAPAVSPRSSP